MKLYSNEAVLKVLNHYNELNGEIETIQEGSLGYGLMVCYGDGLKTCIIREVFLNAWESGHTIRFYKKNAEKISKND